MRNRPTLLIILLLGCSGWGCSDTIERVEPWEMAAQGRVTGEFVEVTSGADHACALARNGSVKCWGSNRYGQLEVPGAAFRTIDAGGYHSCGVTEGGELTCWGLGSEPAREESGIDSDQAVPPSGKFSGVGAGVWHTCALTTGAEIECWGAGSAPQKGSDVALVRVGQGLPPDGMFRQVGAGAVHTCALNEARRIECWGVQPLENGEKHPFGFRQAFPPTGRYASLEAGAFHNCALEPSGAIDCWGLGTEAGEREGTTSVGTIDYDQASPPDRRFRSLAAGHLHSCGIRPGGSVRCWGLGTERNRNEMPADAERDWDYDQAVSPEGEFVGLSAGGAHTCGIAKRGDVLCWGSFKPRASFWNGDGS